jgi:hypothetical protein
MDYNTLSTSGPNIVRLARDPEGPLEGIRALRERIDDLVSAFLEDSGCPRECADLLSEIADDVFEEPDETRTS